MRRGFWSVRQLLSEEWIERSWAPCSVRPGYGYIRWRNDEGRIPTAPRSARFARGNAGRHPLWIDPERELVIAAHWGDDVDQLLAEVSAAVPIHRAQATHWPPPE